MALRFGSILHFPTTTPLVRPNSCSRFLAVNSSSSSSSSSAAAVAMAPLTSRIGVAQMTSVNDPAANFLTCSRLVEEAAAADVKLLCFPEGFSFVGARAGESSKIAETLDGPIMQQYRSLARDNNIWLSLGGFQEKGPDESHIYNTHVLLDGSGDIKSVYRKIHLFDVDVPGNMVYKESDFTLAGEEVVAEDTPIGCLGLTVCYDLRFPDLYQQLRFQHHAEILLVPSAFTRITGQAHWEVLLRARAIETQCFVVAAAQAGKHNEKRESYGDALIVDPWGKIIARLSDRLATGIAVADIDLSQLKLIREKMPLSEHRKPHIFQKSSSL